MSDKYRGPSATTFMIMMLMLSFNISMAGFNVASAIRAQTAASSALKGDTP